MFLIITPFLVDLILDALLVDTVLRGAGWHWAHELELGFGGTLNPRIKPLVCFAQGQNTLWTEFQISRSTAMIQLAYKSSA